MGDLVTVSAGDYVTRFVSEGAWAAIKALLLFLIALLVAKIVKDAVLKLFTKTRLNKLLGSSSKSAEEKERVAGFLSKLTSLIVFVLFVPGIFELLGMTAISAPILNLLTTVWGYLPNVLAAVIVTWVGFFIAGLVKDLLIPVFNRIKVNALQEKAGIEVNDTAKLSNTLAYIVYVLILIPVIITALNVLNIDTISAPAVTMLDTIFAYIPNILGALVILVIGCLVAKLVGNIVERLIAASGLDAKLAAQLDGKAGSFVLSKVAGAVVRVVAIIFFVVESVNVLKLAIVTYIGSAIIDFLPVALVAVLILLVCYVASAAAEKALRKNGHETGALLAKVAIYVVGGFMILNELRVATEIVNTAFIIVVAAAGVAFALAFGLGGRDFAGRMLKKLENLFDKKND